MRKGYRKKPKYIYLIALFYFSVPLLTLWQFAMNVDYSWNLLEKIISSKFYLVEFCLSFTAGMAVLSVTRAGFFYLIFLSAYTLGIKIQNLNYNALFEYPLDFVVLFFWFMMTILFVFTALRVPFLNPDTRWWRQPPRYSHKMPGKLIVNGREFPMVTLNISAGGMFVTLDENAVKEVFTIGQSVALDVGMIPEAARLFKDCALKVSAKVAWLSQEDDPNKRGLGLEFIALTRQDKKKLKGYTHLLKSLKLDLRQR